MRVIGLFHLLGGAGALAAAGALLAIPDPVLRATLAPAGFTVLLAACGMVVLLRQERRLTGPTAANGWPGRTPRHNVDPAGMPAKPARFHRTNEPEHALGVNEPENAGRSDESGLLPNRPAAPTFPPRGASEPDRRPQEADQRSLATEEKRFPGALQPPAPTKPEPSDDGPTLESQPLFDLLDEVDRLKTDGRAEILLAGSTAEPGPARQDATQRGNEPETGVRTMKGNIRFGGFNLLRRNGSNAARARATEHGPPVPTQALDEILEEREDERPFVLPAPSPRLLADLGDTNDLLDTEDSRLQSVARAIEDDALLPVAVPVVSLPQRRRRMVHLRLECRHLGQLADPYDLLPGEPGPLRAALDLELLRAAVGACARPRPGSENLPVMVRVRAGSFAGEDALAALRTLLGRRRPEATPLHLVLEDWPSLRAELEMVAILRDARVVVGLELNERPHLSPQAIASRQVELVCLTAAELRHAALGAYDTELIRDIQAMQRSGIGLVATGIGDERSLAEVLDYPIHLGTGRLFGRIG